MIPMRWKNSIVSVVEDGEPVMIDIFKASKFLKDLGKVVPREVKEQFLIERSHSAVPHRIK